MRYSFPSGFEQSQGVLVCINSALVPWVAGSLRQLEARQAWQTNADHEAAYNAVAELQAQMINNCLEELVNVQKATYRLLDTAIYGQQYNYIQLDENGELDEAGAVGPGIPGVPRGSLGTRPDAVLPYVEQVRQAIDNGINGRTYPNYQSSTSMRNQLAEIIEKLEELKTSGGDNSEVITTLQAILAALV